MPRYLKRNQRSSLHYRRKVYERWEPDFDSSRAATYADVAIIGALFVALILVVTLGFQYTLG